MNTKYRLEQPFVPDIPALIMNQFVVQNQTDVILFPSSPQKFRWQYDTGLPKTN